MVRACNEDAGHKITQEDFTLELTGRRPIGRPRIRWRDQVKQDLERRGLSWTDVTITRVYGMIENIGGGYLILDPLTRDTTTDDDYFLSTLYNTLLISMEL